MMTQKTVAVAAIAALFLSIWAQFAYNVHSSSNDCTAVSSFFESCYISLQSGTYFLKAENLCCKSLDNLENRIREHELTRNFVCECFKVSDNDKQVFVNENLLEVQTLCGAQVSHLITNYSDCLRYTDKGKNGIEAL